MENENKPAGLEQETGITHPQEPAKPEVKEERVTLPTAPLEESDEDLMGKLGMNFDQFQPILADITNFREQMFQEIAGRLERGESARGMGLQQMMMEKIDKHTKTSPTFTTPDIQNAVYGHLSEKFGKLSTQAKEAQDLISTLSKQLLQLSHLRPEMPITEEEEGQALKNITDNFVTQTNENPFFRYVLGKALERIAESKGL